RVDRFCRNPILFIKMAQRPGRAVVTEESAGRCSNPERIVMLGQYRRDAIPRKLPADFDHISKMAAFQHVDAIRCPGQKIAVPVADNGPDFVALQPFVRRPVLPFTCTSPAGNAASAHGDPDQPFAVGHSPWHGGHNETCICANNRPWLPATAASRSQSESG